MKQDGCDIGAHSRFHADLSIVFDTNPFVLCRTTENSWFSSPYYFGNDTVVETLQAKKAE